LFVCLFVCFFRLLSLLVSFCVSSISFFCVVLSLFSSKHSSIFLAPRCVRFVDIWRVCFFLLLLIAPSSSPPFPVRTAPMLWLTISHDPPPPPPPPPLPLSIPHLSSFTFQNVSPSFGVLLFLKRLRGFEGDCRCPRVLAAWEIRSVQMRIEVFLFGAGHS
jgi:hypothetical protein